MFLTGRLAVVALLGVGVVVGVEVLGGGGWGVVVVNVALVGVVAFDVLRAGSVRRLGFSRSGDTNVRLGEAATVSLTVTNPAARPVRGMLRDAWPPSAGAVAPRRAIAVAPGERIRLSFTLLPTRRGDRRAARVTVRAVGPLGLAGRQGSHAVPWQLRVLPPFTSRKHLPSKLAQLRDLDGRTQVMVRGQGTEFDSLREYVPGDDVRSIDWRASARVRDVVVRTWRPERDRRVLIVVDTGRTAAGRVGDAPRLDAALDAALLLAALAMRAGDRVELIAFDRVLRASVQGRSTAELLPSLVQAMAPLEAQLVEPDWDRLAAEITRRARRRSLVVLLSALDPSAVEYGLLPVVARLTTKHVVLLASVADPRLAQMAAARGDVTSVYEAAAAARVSLDRARVGARLSRAGVVVVEGVPADLPPRLADAYLALKAAGRL